MNDLTLNTVSAPVPGERAQLSGRDMLALLRDHILEVLGVAACVVALAVAYVMIATPEYQADVLVRIDPPEPNALGINTQGPLVTPPAPSPSTEMAVMTSRSVLDPVIQKFRFDVSVTPHTFPILGAIAKRFATPGQPAPAWFGLRSYAWGGERVRVGDMTVPPAYEETELKLVALENGRYALKSGSGEMLLSGTVGQPAHGANGVSMLITQLAARPGTEFSVTHWNMLDAVKRFTKVLKVTDKVKDTGLVEITYDDPSPERAAEVANAVSEQYMATAIASRQRNDTATLAFITKELPRLKDELTRAEQALSAYQTSSQSMQPTSEAQAYLQGGIDLDRRIAELQIQRTQLLDRYTPDSRWVKNVDDQLQQLNSMRNQFNARFTSMPVSERKNIDLARDAKVAESVYLGMTQKAEELSVRRASTTGGAHIVDNAVVPFKPIKPEKLIILPASLLLGLIFGAGSVFVRRHVMTGVTDPRYVEYQVGVPLMGEVFMSPQQAHLNDEVDSSVRRLLTTRGAVAGLPQSNAAGARGAGPQAGFDKAKVLSDRFPQDPSVEALRGVHTALMVDLVHAPNNVVMVAGPTPAAGKSFIAANLAVLHAEGGTRVLLIDADMRRGHLAYYFGQTNRGGLSEVLKGEVQPFEVMRPVGIEGVTLMSCGSRPVNPAALLMKPGFKHLLKQVSAEFDLVIIDTPPFLGVADAGIMAGDAGSTVLVLRSGAQSEFEIAETVKKLERARARIAGAVFNGIPARRSNRYYGYASRSAPMEFDAVV